MSNETIVCDWLRRSRMAIVETPFFFLDFQKQKYETKSFIELMERAKINVVRFGVARTYAYYQSKIAPIAPTLGDRDLLAEMIEQCHPRGIKVVAYVHIGYENWILYDEHPNWVERDSDMSPMLVGRPEEVHMCPNSPYLDWKIKMLEEIVNNYNIDAMYFDGPSYFGYCYCNYCQGRFRHEHDAFLPREEDWEDPMWKTYMEWRYQVLESAFIKMKRHIHAIKRIPIIYNNITHYHERCRRESRQPERLTKIADGILFENHRTQHNRPFYRLGQHVCMGVATGKPTWIWWEYNVGDWSFQPCSDPELRLKFAEVLAHGATLGVFPFDAAWYDPQGIRVISECFGFQEANEERIFSVRPTRFLGHVFSRQTAEWYGAAKTDEKYCEPHSGMYKALFHAHAPLSFIIDQNVTYEYMKHYRIVCLNNMACMSEDQIAAIERYVDRGGNILVTHETSLYDERGVRRRNFGLAHVLGVDFVQFPQQFTEQIAPGYPVKDKGRKDWVMWTDVPVPGGKPPTHSYMKITKEHPVTDGLIGKLLPIKSHVYVNDRNDNSLGWQRGTSLHSHPLGDETGFPAVVAGTYGKGKFVYIAGDVGEAYFDSQSIRLRNLVENAIRWFVDGELPVKVAVPKNVEIALHEGKDRLIVYLVNFISDAMETSEEITETIPLHDVDIRIKVPEGRSITEATALRSKKSLVPEIQGKYCKITLPRLEEFELVSFELS